MHKLQELVRLYRKGTSTRTISRLLGMSRNTERRYRKSFEAAGLLAGPIDDLPELSALQASLDGPKPTPDQETSSIEQWRPKVDDLLKAGLTALPIYNRLNTDQDFDGSYYAVKRMVRRLRRAGPVAEKDVAIPVETAPGDVAQVDFGYVGKLMCPETHVPRRAWVFVMVLGFSRHMYAEVVFDQKIETWLALHVRAFKWFGGVPAVVVPDNLKAAVIRAAFSVTQDIGLNRSYRELARFYEFKIDPTPPYSPQKKGKVEAAVKYLKGSVLAGREGEYVTGVNKSLRSWLVDVAGRRVHGTTRQQPLSVFEEVESAMLLALPDRPFEPVKWAQAKVHPDAHISFERALYSVPWRWCGEQVWVKASKASVTIFAEECRVALHEAVPPGRRSTKSEHLPEHRRDRRHRSRGYWEERADQVGAETGGLVREIFESDDVLYQLRAVQAVVGHLETFPVDRAESAAKRARFFGTYTYAGVKAILSKALDLEPLPAVLFKPADGKLRFARDMSELVAQKLEADDEPH